MQDRFAALDSRVKRPFWWVGFQLVTARVLVMLARTFCISAALLALPVTAQEPGPPSGALGGDGSQENPYRMPPGYRGNSGDEMGLELHRRLPGYAGIYFDRERNGYVIRIKRGQPHPSATAARKAVSEVRGGPQDQFERLAFEDADRDMAELIALKDQVARSWVSGEMSGLGIKVKTGRVSIGVLDRKNMAGTTAMLKRLGIPTDAVEIVELQAFIVR